MTPILIAAALTIGVVAGGGIVGITAGRRIHHLEDLLDTERAHSRGGAR